MILLGLAGHAGSGKDTVADYLCQQYGFIQFSFSDFLYAEISAAFGLDDESLLRGRETKEVQTERLALNWCQDREFIGTVVGVLAAENENTFFPLGEMPLSPRQILQWWGTEYRRKQDPNYWVNQAADFVFGLRGKYPYPELAPQYFVNTSVRFENERQWVRHMWAGPQEWNGNVWHLRRDAAAPVHAHESENPLPVLEGERELFNNGDIEYLYKGVDKLLSSAAQFIRVEAMKKMEEPPLPVGTIDE